jgi:hypothetical protein
MRKKGWKRPSSLSWAEGMNTTVSRKKVVLEVTKPARESKTLTAWGSDRKSRSRVEGILDSARLFGASSGFDSLVPSICSLIRHIAPYQAQNNSGERVLAQISAIPTKFLPNPNAAFSKVLTSPSLPLLHFSTIFSSF